MLRLTGIAIRSAGAVTIDTQAGTHILTLTGTLRSSDRPSLMSYIKGFQPPPT